MDIIQRIRKYLKRKRAQRKRKKLIWSKIDYFNQKNIWRAEILLRTSQGRIKDHFLYSTDLVLASTIPSSLLTAIIFATQSIEGPRLYENITYILGALAIYTSILAGAGGHITRRMANEYCINKNLSKRKIGHSLCQA